MPKTPKRRHVPLDVDITTGPPKQKATKKKFLAKQAAVEEEEGTGGGSVRFVDAKASRQILELGQALTHETEPQNEPKLKSRRPGYDDDVDVVSDDDDEYASSHNNPFQIESRFVPQDDSALLHGDEDQAWEEMEDDELEEEVEEVDIEDLELYRKFMPDYDQEDPLLAHGWSQQPDEGDDDNKNNNTPVNLADLILAKIAAKEAERDGIPADEIAPEDALGGEDTDADLPAKVIEVFTKIGFVLSRWKSGKFPKPFKILPTIPRWEEIIQYTEPDQWTPNATYEATKIFTSGRKEVARVYLEMILLPKVRDDIRDNNKLNVHYFRSVKKALYSRSSWFKGFLFPLASNGLTVREATIIAAIISRVSIPILHSAAGLAGLCEIAAQGASSSSRDRDATGGGAVNILIKALLEKKYALPWSVVDALVFHFLRFKSIDPASVQRGQEWADVGGDNTAPSRVRLPVIWHQCFLAFSERYKNDITEDAREALLDLLLVHEHPQITPEIRKELLSGRGRGVIKEEILAQAQALDGDDTMMMG